MWRCLKCGEEIEDSFDACWGCGTSIDGIEDPAFQVETVESVDARVGWDCMFAGAIVAAILGAVEFVVPYVTVTSLRSMTGGQFHYLLVGTAIWCLLLGVGGGIAGWLGGRTEKLVAAAKKGAVVFIGVALVLDLGFVGSSLFALPLAKTIAILVSFVSLGAIAASVGSIVGRRRRRKSLGEPIQYSLSDMLFLMLLATLLFASLAVLLRQGL